MYQRIEGLENSYFEQILRIIRITAIFVSLFVVTSGLLIQQSIISSRFYHSDLVFLVVAVLLLVTALVQWLASPRNYILQASCIIALNLLGAAYLLFVAGVGSPFIVIWVVSMVAADLYFGFKGYLLSALLLFITVALNTALHPNIYSREIFQALIGALLVVITGYTISHMRAINERERLAYNKAKRKETLQRQRLTTLINAMGDAVISTDENGHIRVYNAASLSLLDTNAMLSGLAINGVLKLYDTNDKPIKILELAKKANRVFSRNDLTYRYSNGEKLNLYINAAPIRPSYRQHQVQGGYIFILRDITKEKSLEEERDEFISVVSHELRTPIAIAEGTLSNLQLLMSKNTDPTLLPPAINDAHNQVIFLARMINDLSTLSRAERGTADEAESIDVDELIGVMYEKYRPEAEAKGLQLNLDLAPKLGQVSASRLYLEEVLQNFITNAIKYTKKGSVTIAAKRQKDGDIQFAIEDTGFGISKSDQKKIFEKFYRSEDYRTRETSGTGLGLYVVQKLATKLGIRIEVRSRLNHGSTFSFVLPTK